MEPRALATSILVAAGVLPWLTILPGTGVSAVAAQVLTLVAAFHGAGQGVVRIVRGAPVHPLVAIQLGIATLVAVCGIAIMLGVAGYTFQVILVTGCAGLHSVLLVVDRRRHRADLERALAAGWRWVLPACLLLALAFVHVLGAAGDVGARPFDDDGNVLAQLQRLRDTGTLGDLIGYPRRAQLGGQTALTALATIPGDVHLARVMEGLAFVLALGLALAQLRVTSRDGALLGILLLAAASALPYVQVDPTTLWTAVGLILALHVLLQGDREARGLPLALVAGALTALRLELAPLAAVALVEASAGTRASLRQTVRVLGLALAVVAPYLLARANAVSYAHVLPADKRLPWLVAVAVFAGTCLACAPLVVWTWRSPRLRWFGVAAALTIAGIASELTGDRPYGLRFLWPIAFAGAAILVIELARSAIRTTALMLVALALALIIHDGRTATGRRRWPRRYLDLVDNVEYLGHHGAAAPITASYDALLAKVPPRSTVGVWVLHPERLSYAAGHRLVDLRTPRVASLRTHRWTSHASRIEKLADAARLDFLLIERDDRRRLQVQTDWMYRFICTEERPGCADDLEVLAVNNPTVASHGGVVLVDLRAAR